MNTVGFLSSPWPLPPLRPGHRSSPVPDAGLWQPAHSASGRLSFLLTPDDPFQGAMPSLSLGPQALLVALSDLPQGSKSSAQSRPRSPNLEPRAHFSLVDQELGL